MPENNLKYSSHVNCSKGVNPRSGQTAVSRPYYYCISRNVTAVTLRVWYSAYYTIPAYRNPLENAKIIP